MATDNKYTKFNKAFDIVVDTMATQDVFIDEDGHITRENTEAYGDDMIISLYHQEEEYRKLEGDWNTEEVVNKWVNLFERASYSVPVFYALLLDFDESAN